MAASLALGGLALLASGRPARAVDLRGDGVVCDGRERVCYDDRGASLSETRRRYGREAERELVRRLSGRPPLREVLFSSGELCDFQQRQCWDDGWRRRNASNRLTRHLFGSSGGSGSGVIDGVADRGCLLRRSGRTLYRGRCRFSNDWEGGERSYLVQTGDGRRYRFLNRSGRLWLRDATGSWPVSTARRSGEVVFLWSDLQLEVERRAAGIATPYGTGPYPVDPYERRQGIDPRPPEQQVIEQLIEGLFR